MPRKCIIEGCPKSPTCNYPEEASRLYCGFHKLEGMVTVGYKKCIECNKKTALFGFDVKEYCADHAKPGMINLKKKKCAEPECDVQPYFNYPGKKVGWYCDEHKKEGMVNVFSNKCKECNTVASYAKKGEKAEYCVKHKKEEMINVKSNLCAADCTKQASFNYPGETKYLYCADHKLEGMINLRKNTCKFTGCTLAAVFNNPDEKKGKYCALHKEDGMINIYANRCEECDIVANFNYSGEKKARFCNDHKLDGMINIYERRKCLECDKVPSYGYLNEEKLYCGDHKKPDMINLNSKYCDEDCEKTAIYAFPGNSPCKCSEHKKEGMISQPRKKCIKKGCNEFAIYGTTVQNHCEPHQEEGEVNLIEKKCESCGLLNILNEQNICKYCDPDLEKKVRLAKQKDIEAFLKANKFKFISTDKIIESGKCGKERPDFLFDCGTYFVVLEVDENQHKERACECEQTRMVNISQSLGLTTIFLRYNPDTFVTNKIKKDPVKTTRFSTLKKWLNYLLKLDIEEVKEYGFLSVLYLFFDGYIAQSVKYQTILENE